MKSRVGLVAVILSVLFSCVVCAVAVFAMSADIAEPQVRVVEVEVTSTPAPAPEPQQKKKQNPTSVPTVRPTEAQAEAQVPDSVADSLYYYEQVSEIAWSSGLIFDDVANAADSGDPFVFFAVIDEVTPQMRVLLRRAEALTPPIEARPSHNVYVRAMNSCYDGLLEIQDGNLDRGIGLMESCSLDIELAIELLPEY